MLNQVAFSKSKIAINLFSECRITSWTLGSTRRKRMMSSRWQRRSFPTSVPLTKRPPGNYLYIYKAPLWQSQNTGVRLKQLFPPHFPIHKQSKQDTLEGQEAEEQLHSTCITSLPGWQSATRRGPLGHGFSSGKKRAHSSTSSTFKSLPWRPTHVSPHRNSKKVSARHKPYLAGDKIMMKNGGWDFHQPMLRYF